MFIVSLTYQADLAAIDAHLAEHVEFLERHYDAGHFVLSGRKVPRTGGVIIVVGVDRDELAGILAEDPFAREGLAGHEVIEVRPTKAAPGWEHLVAPV